MYSYNNRYLIKDGRPILPVMGEFHFSRYPRGEWKTELYKMKAGGIEIAATYVFWLHHEEVRGEWDFSGQRDLRAFLECCKETGIKVWLRIGPWAHGECRNGGFPDWLIGLEKSGKMKLRENDEEYLKLVDDFYSHIGEQAQGMMYKDGGPVIGIQIENEYGHCGGPKDRAAGMAHMNTLKHIAIKYGLEAEYYSATGWGGAYVPEGFLPVLGGYVDAPWAEHTRELEPSENFLFKPFHDDTNIGSDLSAEHSGFTFNPDRVPYLTAELGGGLQVTGHRRTYPYPDDIEAQTVCMLGAGANLIGYYMYHGGCNPKGKLTSLQESRATGYNNDYPEISYDFQTCIRENGLANESFFRLRKVHMFIKAVEELLAPAAVYPYEQGNNNDPENMTDIRACFKYNEFADCGFLFINNHQRKRHMTDMSITTENPLVFSVKDNAGNIKDICFEKLTVKADECYILPYNLPLGEDVLEYTNCGFIGEYYGKYYFYTDDKPWFKWKSGREHPEVTVLTTHQAEHCYFVNGKALISEGIVLEDGRELILEKMASDSKMNVKMMQCSGGKTEVTKEKTCESEGMGQEFSECEIDIDYGSMNTFEDVILDMDFGGDSARLFDAGTGELLTDWFSNGENWRVALKRYGYPNKLLIKMYPFKEEVYYDLEPKKERILRNVSLEIVKSCINR